jgi:hypothetical protein
MRYHLELDEPSRKICYYIIYKLLNINILHSLTLYVSTLSKLNHLGRCKVLAVY